MTTKHTATLPDGTLATRTSASRVYPFVIAREPELASEIVRRVRDDLSRYRSQDARYEAIAAHVEAGGEVKVVEGRFLSTVQLPDLLGDTPRGIGWLDGEGRFCGQDGETVALQIAAWFRACLTTPETYATLEARIVALKAGPERVGPWEAVTWTSRPDLAAKAAARLGTATREARVIDTERVSK